ncbi:MAG: ATP phosphoribosyltransferase regulatory subunit [Eubacteriales bacterium]|nr:ATP phosphoribosyltransferase regulatory subunit [Eubacteriales bacterium]
MKKRIHTPEGVRDIFAKECDKKRYLERRIERLYRSYGYQSIETPSFEFFDVFASEVGTTPSTELYKFFDRDGHTLVLRPDFTPSIARAVSMYFNDEDMPLRLCYHGNVFRNNHSYQGRLKENTEMGVEYFNDDSPEADAEVIALVASTMRRAGLTDYIVSVGHVDFFQALAEDAGLDEDSVSELKGLLSSQNRFGAEEMIDRMKISDELKQAFKEMPALFGDVQILEKAKTLTSGTKAVEAIARLETIYELLKIYGCADHVAFDLGMVTEYSYYTGIIFQAYSYGSGDALIRGGRYNRLLQHFGKKADAVGFVTDIGTLLNALDRQNVPLPIDDIKTMILYPEEIEKEIIGFAAEERQKGMDAACVRFEYGKVLDNYKEYGRRNQFGGILYFRSLKEAYAINLITGETSRIQPF